ncbi:hypothetical protein C7N43_05440 [Sphingobacteriales bacterium UPWRP_1]|nr:hypothetical protein BVG80_06315 [Sphingobacteriales bacterium TSM_CSM]PSJ78022.1 hypothetical protein C7N43_05440 [Sphingobacteriales bacterium UPWRP_1]
MYSTVSDFLTEWKTETDNTLKIFGALTNETLFSAVHPNVRTLGRLAWHITQTLTEMPARAGLLSADTLEHVPCPTEVSAITEQYAKHADAIAAAVQLQWTDATLQEQVEMYGEQWAKGFALRVLVTHQIHHRAQMTIVMRLLDLTVPGIYGPSKEEWAAWGMQAAE